MSHAENIHSAIPAVHRLMSSPAVYGALTSILGEGYALHPHTFMHVKDEVNGGDGDWHKRAPNPSPSSSAARTRGSSSADAGRCCSQGRLSPREWPRRSLPPAGVGSRLLLPARDLRRDGADGIPARHSLL